MRVALTIDAEHPDRPKCPPGNVERLLDTLEAAGVMATFFLQGRWVEAYPETAVRIATSRHLVGSHSFYHARLPLLSPAGLRADIAAAERIIRDVTGRDPRPYFRMPFSDGATDAAVLDVLHELGYRDFGFDAPPWGDGVAPKYGDWEPERTADEIVEWAVDGAVAHGDGAVVMLHSWPRATAGALPRIIERLRAQGAEFLTLDTIEATRGELRDHSAVTRAWMAPADLQRLYAPARG